MASEFPDSDKIRDLAAVKGLQKLEDIASAAGLSERTIFGLLKFERKSIDTFRKLAAWLGVDWRELIVPPEIARLRSKRATVRVPTAHAESIFVGPSETSSAIQDVKLVLTDHNFSESLIGASKVPSLACCLGACRTMTPKDDAHKDHAFFPEWTYNHFVQVGAMLIAATRNGEALVGYYRDKRMNLPSNEHTNGMAVLFGASPPRSLNGLPPSALDRWLAFAAQDATGARDAMTDGKRAVLLELLRYKVDLSGLACQIKPVGVITNDQRPLGYRRVYTQYIFTVRPTKWRESTVSSQLAELGGSWMRLCLLTDDIVPERTFIGSKGESVMDVLAWRAFHNREMKLSQIGSARAHRGFNVVDGC